MKKLLSGNYAAAYGTKLARPKVIPIYPITPQTTIVEKLAEFCSNGELDARIIDVESEHSAMATCIGAAATGVRVFTATASQGLALMHELLFWSGLGRLPIVLANVHRALGPPWNSNCEQTDSLAQRDTGWIQLECESAQEVLDTVIEAFYISEQALLPCMVCLDGFYLSHTYEPVDIPASELVDKYLPQYTAKFKLDPQNPLSFYASSTANPTTAYEIKYHTQKAMEKVPKVFERAEKDFSELFGREYGAVKGDYLDGAELVIVAAGSMVTTLRGTVAGLRQQGKKVGMLRIKMFRPFPRAEIRRLLRGVPKVAVIDRNISFGEGGIYYHSIKSALYGLDKRPAVFGFIAGLAGTDITPHTINEIINYTLRQDSPKEEIIWTEPPR